MHRTAAALRLIVPSLWLGLIIGLALIEAPLKFTAPGITTALGLGIGRIMFTALGIAGWFLLVVLVAASLIRPRVGRVDAVLLGGMALMLVLETIVIRPFLNARSDLVIAGIDPGESILHYAYIAAEGVLIALLVVWIVRAARSLRLAPPVAD
ncbi:MAG: hypothetical protein R2732_07825 [Microbacteriaceae bacterium]